MANTKQNNIQGERALISEWLQTFPASYRTKTNVLCEALEGFYAGVPLTPAQARAFSVDKGRCDARVFTGAQVLIVEGKVQARDGAYGQVLGYVRGYPSSEDYRQFAPAPIVPVVVGIETFPVVAAYWAAFGVQTINFTPSFSLAQALLRLYPAAQVLGGTGAS
jgi:hypothetical protein